MYKGIVARLRQQAGFFSTSDVAREVGINLKTFWRWQKDGLILQPKATFAGLPRLYYTRTEVDKIKKLFESKKVK